MTTYYAGLTAYLKNTPDTKRRFTILAEALPQLTGCVGEPTERFVDQRDMMNRDANAARTFNHVQQHNHLLASPSDAFPLGTPESSKYLTVTTETIKGIDFVRLHIPMNAENSDVLYMYTSLSLPNLLWAIFGTSLTCVKTKFGHTAFGFDDIPVATNMSSSRYAVNL